MNQIPNLLIVDDVKTSIMLLEAVIRSVRVNVIKAYSGSEALEKTKGIDLALAIIDVQMPGMNGYELAVNLNEERSADKVPVIFLTATFINENEILEGYKTGAVDYLIKPIAPHILLSKIKVFLELHAQKHTILIKAAQLKSYTDELTRVNLKQQKSEKKYRSYIDNAPDGVFVFDSHCRCRDVNRAATRITGYSRVELLKMCITDLFADKSLEEGLNHFRNLLTTGRATDDLRFISKNKKIGWMTFESVKVGKSRFISFTKDITKRRIMEDVLIEQQLKLEMLNEELKKSKKEAERATLKYSELFDSAPTCYFTLSADNLIIELNFSGARLLDVKRSELIGTKLDNFVSESSLSTYNNFLENIFKSYTKQVCELMIETHENKQKYVLVEGMVADEGKQCLINLVDITERKLAEQTIKISEEKYRTMLSASPDGILLINLKRIITEVSEIALELLGTDNKNDIIGKNISLFVPGDENETLKDIFEKTVSEGLVQNVGLRIRKKSQQVFTAEASVTLIQRTDGSPLSFMFIIRDISQRTKMEATQIHASRMASLGEMASGIAHEINQPLNIISMVMDKILFESSKADVIDINFIKIKSDKIFDNITRIRNIIDHIRAFSRSHDDYVPTVFNVNLSIENAVSMISEQFKYLGIDLDIILDEMNPSIPGNTFKFEQVMINLLNNSKDAVMEKHSTQDSLFRMCIKIISYLNDNSLVVEVIDNGIGINAADIHNVMLPFFTTKDEGKGTGLGLSICYQIIKEMDGSIEVQSQQNIGTTVRMNFACKNKNENNGRY